MIALFIGPYVIKKLREFQVRQYIREDGPQSHLKKSGTPTMGGVLILIAILVPTVLWSDPANPFVWVAVLSTLAFGAIGFAVERWTITSKVVKRRSLGADVSRQEDSFSRRWQRFWLRTCWLDCKQFNMFSTRLTVPFIKQWRPDLLWHWWPATLPHMAILAFTPFVLFVMFVLVGSSNAVNLTDGLDGLAIGCIDHCVQGRSRC